MVRKASINELLGKFSKQGREKAEYIIKKWDYVVPGTKEILLRSEIKDKTLARICHYKNEYIHVKEWLMDMEKLVWLEEVASVERTKEGYAYNVFLDSLSYESIDYLIEWILLSKKPIDILSWEILSNEIAIKTIDQSSITNNGTIIPQKIRKFFGADLLKQGQSKPITLIYRDVFYDAKIEVDSTDMSRARLIWEDDFAFVIDRRLPQWHEVSSEKEEIDTNRPKIRFNKIPTESNEYKIDFINPQIINNDIYSEETEVIEGSKEGGSKYLFVKSYERSLENRKRAIERHGVQCSVCDFNFERFYGEIGIGFIEVHHTKPLSSLNDKIVVNPYTDLVPICSNCHRMIHRSRDKVLSIDELKNIIKKMKS